VAAQDQLPPDYAGDIALATAAGSEERKAVDFLPQLHGCRTHRGAGACTPAARTGAHRRAASSADVVRYMGYNQTIGIGEPLAWSAPQDPGDARSYITEIDQSG